MGAFEQIQTWLKEWSCISFKNKTSSSSDKPTPFKRGCFNATLQKTRQPSYRGSSGTQQSGTDKTNTRHGYPLRQFWLIETEHFTHQTSRSRDSTFNSTDRFHNPRTPLFTVHGEGLELDHTPPPSPFPHLEILNRLHRT